MQTKQEMFLDYLGSPDIQLIIPVYQRVYAWTEHQCDVLWADVMRAGHNRSTHFIGTLLYSIEPGNDDATRRFDLIDGQQRAATFTLLLTALRDYLQSADLRFDGIDADIITQRYLHTGEDGECKLLLSRLDRATMAAIIEGAELPEEDDLSANIVQNHRRFREKMDNGFSAEDAQVLWDGMQRLLIIAAELEDDDRPQLIFESLNSKGMALTTADLVRNLMLANASYDEQTRLYERYWAPIEALYSDDPDSTRLNAALHGWLAITAPQLHIGGKDDVYGAFKTYLEDIRTGTLEELLIGLKGFCETFDAKSQASGANRERERTAQSSDRPSGIINERKLFGD